MTTNVDKNRLGETGKVISVWITIFVVGFTDGSVILSDLGGFRTACTIF